MAAKTPALSSVSGYVGPLSVWGGVNAVSTALIATGALVGNRNGLKLSIFYFENIDDADVWSGDSTWPPPKGIIALAWQVDQADEDMVGATLTTQGDVATDTVITFDSESADSNGWLWVLHKS